jgi:hypothetical protein
MELELIKEETNAEAILLAEKEGSGVIIPKVTLASAKMSTTDPTDTVNIALGTDNCVWFTFSKGKRPIKFHLGIVLMEAYRLAMEE